MMTPSIDGGLIYRGTRWTVDGVPMGYERPTPPRSPIVGVGFLAFACLIGLETAVVSHAAVSRHGVYAAQAPPVPEPAVQINVTQIAAVIIAAYGVFDSLKSFLTKRAATRADDELKILKERLDGREQDIRALTDDLERVRCDLKEERRKTVEGQREIGRQIATANTKADAVQGQVDALTAAGATPLPSITVNVEAAKPAG